MWFVLLRHIKGRDYCQAVKKIQLVLYLGTEQGSSSLTCCSLQLIAHVPAHASLRGLNSERNTGYIPTSLLFEYLLGEFGTKPGQKAAGTCALIMEHTSVPYDNELP